MEAKDFAAQLEPVREMWTWIDLRAIAVKEPNLGWRSDRLRATLVHDPPVVRTDLPEHPEVLALQAAWPVARLEELTTALEAGELNLDGTTLHLKTQAGEVWQRLSFHMRTYDREQSISQFGIDWSAIALHGWGSIGRDPRRMRAAALLDGELRGASNRPWDGLADLRRDFVGASADDARRDDFVSADVVAPLLLRFRDRAEVTGKDIRLSVERKPSVDIGGVRVAVFVKVADETMERFPISFEPSDLSPDGKVLVRTVHPSGPFSGAICCLSYRGVDTDRMILLGPGAVRGHPRWAIFRAMVGAPDDLAERFETLDGGDPFEHAVAALFHLLGFAVQHFGQKTFGHSTDLPDMVAISSSGDLVYVIECTRRAVDAPAEIAKLATRTREMAAALQGMSPRPVFVTGQPRGALPDAAREDAAKEQVALVAREDIEGLIQLSLDNPSLESVKSHLAGLIPSRF